MLKKVKTSEWDASKHIKTDEDMVAYLDAALEENDPQLIVAVIGDIVKKKGMAQIAVQTEIELARLYKALSPGGSPDFSIIMEIVNALGLQLHATKKV